jgi:hypothetical protein
MPLIEFEKSKLELEDALTTEIERVIRSTTTTFE